MNEENETTLSPAAEDPVLHRHLVALAAFTPATLFEERVLAGVWMPEPEWVRNLRIVGKEWTDTGRIWLVLGALALGSLVVAAAGAGLVAAFSSEIAAGTAWLLEHGLPKALAATTSELAVRWQQVAPDSAFVQFTGVQVASVAAMSVVLLAACTWGLRKTMRPEGVR